MQRSPYLEAQLALAGTFSGQAGRWAGSRALGIRDLGVEGIGRAGVGRHEGIMQGKNYVTARADLNHGWRMGGTASHRHECTGTNRTYGRENGRTVVSGNGFNAVVRWPVRSRYAQRSRPSLHLHNEIIRHHPNPLDLSPSRRQQSALIR
jgi:hypothetical protein